MFEYCFNFLFILIFDFVLVFNLELGVLLYYFIFQFNLISNFVLVLYLELGAIYQSPRLVFTHMPTVPVVGMGKEGRTIIDPWGSADREQDWQPYPVDAQSFESDNDTQHT